MQHLNEFLHSVRLPIRNILSCYCQITEKVDGSAFQYYNDGISVHYGKRGDSPSKKSNKEIDDFDLLMNPVYYNAYTCINNKKDLLDDDIKILNFEIFNQEQNNHIIHYNGQYINDIVLLSGYDKDGNQISYERLSHIAELLEISLINVLYRGFIPQEYISTIMENKDDVDRIWHAVADLCKVNKLEHIEGFVMTFKKNDESTDVKRIMKIQNPDFQNKIIKHLNDEQNNKASVNLENLYNRFITAYKCTSTVSDSSSVKKLINLYMACEYASEDLKYLEKSLENIEILRNHLINIKLAKKICPYFPDSLNDIEYPLLLNFILLAFRNKRVKKPLWCSLEYQLNVVNPFLDEFIFNNKNS